MSFAITVLGTQYVAATNAAAPATFWGLTSDTPISSVDFTIQGTAAQGGTTGFPDNFRYGTAQTGSSGNPSDTPEAATLVLIGSGLIGLAGLRKRIKPAEPA
jgi:hypothetical protein